MTLDQLDEELAIARASLKRLRETTIAEFTADAEQETNPYTRQFILDTIDKVRARASAC